jgi:hypothetical protein
LVGWLVGHKEVTRTSCCLFSFITRARPFQTFYALWVTPKMALNFGFIGRSVGHGEVTRTSRCLVSFVTRARPSQPFYTLRAPPQNGLKFWLVGRSRGSHTNVTLPLQFRHQGTSFPTLLRPAGHPQIGLKFWLVGRSVGRSWGSHTNVTLPLQFHPPGSAFPTLLRLAGHPKTALNFSWSVGWSVGHREVTCMSRCLFSFVTRACPSRTFYALRATPKTALDFGWLVSRSVGRSVGQSRGSHTNVTLPLQFRHQGPPFPTLLCPAGHPENSLQFWSVSRSVGRSVGWSVGRSVTGKSHKLHSASSVLSPGPALPDPSTPCEPPPKWS